MRATTTTTTTTIQDKGADGELERRTMKGGDQGEEGAIEEDNDKMLEATINDNNSAEHCRNCGGV